MYIVSRSTDEMYGNVVAICRSDTGEPSPFFVAEEAKRERRLWAQDGVKARFMVDNQILTLKELDKWVREENKLIPKCRECGNTLSDEVFSNSFSKEACFCSQDCAFRNYHCVMEHMSDYEEFDL